MTTNEHFNPSEYDMPEDAPEKTLSKKDEILEDKTNTENSFEERFKEEKAFLDNLDHLSGKENFEGESAYTEKLKEFAERKKNSDETYGVDYKIYVEKLSQLRDQHQKAIDFAANKIEQERKNISNLSFRDDLSHKIDEIGERKTIIERQLYDLGHYAP